MKMKIIENSITKERENVIYHVPQHLLLNMRKWGYKGILFVIDQIIANMRTV